MQSVSTSTEPTLAVTVCRDEGVAVVALRGRLDAETVEVVRGTLDDLLEDGVRELLLDLDGTAYLADAAAASFADAARWTRSLGGTLHVFRVHGQPRERLQALALSVDGPLLSAPRAV